MKKLFVLFIITFSVNSFAKDLANCSDPKGQSYYPEIGMISKNKSGWTNDGITGGLTKLTVNDKGEFDILFVDTSKTIISSREDGGKVIMNSFSNQSMTFLVVYPGKTIETYTFVKNNSGINEYIHTTVRSGSEVTITKGSLLRGTCSFINFDSLKLDLIK